MHKFKKGWIVVIALLPVLLAACSQSILPRGNTSSVSSGEDAMTNATVTLVHQPTGTVMLGWNPNNSILTVTLHMTGLTPFSSHPAHIHQSTSCQVGGPMLFPLHPVIADASGTGTSTTDIHASMYGIPRTGWIVNVHNGPGLAPTAQSLPIACVAIHNYSRVHGLLVVRYALDPTTAADQHVSGQAWLSVTHHQLTVKVVVHGLVPGSVHMEHIHLGTCAHQGKVLYMLNNLVAGRDGTATTTTIINHVTQIPAHKWYLNVHRSAVLTFPNGKINPTDFDPIACGNIG